MAYRAVTTLSLEHHFAQSIFDNCWELHVSDNMKWPFEVSRLSWRQENKKTILVYKITLGRKGLIFSLALQNINSRYSNHHCAKPY